LARTWVRRPASGLARRKRNVASACRVCIVSECELVLLPGFGGLLSLRSPVRLRLAASFAHTLVLTLRTFARLCRIRRHKLSDALLHKDKIAAGFDCTVSNRSAVAAKPRKPFPLRICCLTIAQPGELRRSACLLIANFGDVRHRHHDPLMVVLGCAWTTLVAPAEQDLSRSLPINCDRASGPAS